MNEARLATREQHRIALQDSTEQYIPKMIGYLASKTHKYHVAKEYSKALSTIDLLAEFVADNK